MSCHFSPLTQESEAGDESFWQAVAWDPSEPGHTSGERGHTCCKQALTSDSADKDLLSASEAAPGINVPHLQDPGIGSPDEATRKQREYVTRLLERASQILEGWVRCESDSSDDEYWDEYPC